MNTCGECRYLSDKHHFTPKYSKFRLCTKNIFTMPTPHENGKVGFLEDYALEEWEACKEFERSEE